MTDLPCELDCDGCEFHEYIYGGDVVVNYCHKTGRHWYGDLDDPN